MTVEYGNWAELQKIIPSTSVPEAVSNDYVFQKNECCYIESATWTHTALYEGYIPSEAQFVESLRKQLYEQQGARLLHCNLTITKTFFQNYWGRNYYHVQANVEKIVIQADDFGLSTAAILIILIILASTSVALTFLLLYPSVIYKIVGLSPEQVNDYNDAQAKIWAQLTGFLNSVVLLVGAAVVGLGIFTIYSGRRKAGR